MPGARQAAPPTRRSPLGVTLGILVAAGVVLAIFANLWTEKLWFDAIRFPGVFSTQLITQVLLFLLGVLLVGGSVALNMLIAFRMRGSQRRRGASAILDRYREMLEGNFRGVALLASLVLGVMAGLSTSTQVMPVLAWLNRTPSGVTDTYFGLDTSFFMFEYPVWRLALSLLMSAIIFGLIAAAVLHFAVGNLVTGRPHIRSATPAPVMRHLSILAGLFMVVYGLQTLLDRYGLMLDSGPLFDGLQYTDDHAAMTAKIVMAVIAFLVAALFFANAFINNLLLPVVGVVLMLVSGLILSLIYPAMIQTFTVRPNEPDRERPYITNHIRATRAAYDVDDVEIQDYSARTTASAGQLRADAEALPAIRLMDPDVIGPTFEQLQQVRGYYSFPDSLDIDRYTLDGTETDLVVAARELNLAGIPDRNWNNIHTVYTHGHGFVSAYGNRRQQNGEPVWVTRDIPPVGKIEEKQSRIYYGEQSNSFAIVGRQEGQPPIELDSPGGGQGGGEQYNVYDGAGGVDIGNVFLRVLYAIKFSDVNVLLSDRVNSASRILYDRTPDERVNKVAPWLTTDQNAYPAVVDGRLVWIIDAYTTSNNYPNSQKVSLADSTSDTQTRVMGAQADEEINYIRNSVKAVVDAYDGTVSLYAWDESDPLLQTYAKAFPGTVKPKSDISPDLLAHLRYPEDLFKVQRQILGRYHMTNSDAWYQQSDLWEVPVDPRNNQDKEPPYYLSIKWPGTDAPRFSQTSVFVPRGRQNLASYFAVNAEAASPDYGKLQVLRMSDTHQIDGPGQTFNAMTTDPKVANLLRDYTNQGAADVRYGNLLTLPVGGGLLYVQPLYTVRTGSAGSYPALTFVVVRFGQSVGIGATLQAALDQVFQGDAGADTGENPNGSAPAPGTGATPAPGAAPSPAPSPGATPSPSPGSGQVDQAAVNRQLDRARTAFADADKALKAGDLATYQTKTNEARQAVQAAINAMGR
ncbi:UPF0182 family membrane protein [Nigerium massiliense]|uniref:UPF0182 family membrane protein n=1 Tax=Nigerium massiliense TaxID=1522317 RepID=UPI00058D4AA0|nr:UPF0182 family protein [Nigerium massiliense]